MRWPDGIVRCPTCGAEKVFLSGKGEVYSSATKSIPRAKFSLKVGTIFEDSPLGLDKWLTAIWLIANSKNGISSYEFSRHLGITQKSAWHILHRIRLAMQNGSINKLSGRVEVDETFIGGKARNMHRAVLAKRVAIHATPYTGRNQNIGKVAVMGLLRAQRRSQNDGSLERQTQIASQRSRGKHVEAGSMVYSDALRSYNRLGEYYIHNVINHADAVRQRPHPHKRH